MKKFKKALEKRPRLRRKKQAAEGHHPRITNETVASHREEVLGSARKYIYPLQHSKHRIVLISVGLAVAVFVLFFTYSVLALYKFQSTSIFIYRVTQVLPLPVARAGNAFVSYEDYLFELRRYVHYYENQLGIDFSDPQYVPQLEDFRRRALDKVVNDAYVKQLAKEHGVSISSQELDEQIDIVRSQNRLGGDDQVFEDVLKEYWGWSVGDFRRSLAREMLTQEVVSALDTQTHDRAETALRELKGGADFAAVAKKYSDDDATKDNGGQFGFAIDQTDRNLPAQTTATLFSLEPGQISDIINIGYALEILKNLERQGQQVRGAHILFTFEDISIYLNELKEKRPPRLYISLPQPEATEDN